MSWLVSDGMLIVLFVRGLFVKCWCLILYSNFTKMDRSIDTTVKRNVTHVEFVCIESNQPPPVEWLLHADPRQNQHKRGRGENGIFNFSFFFDRSGREEERRRNLSLGLPREEGGRYSVSRYFPLPDAI